MKKPLRPSEPRRVLTRVAYLSSTRSDEGRTNQHERTRLSWPKYHTIYSLMHTLAPFTRARAFGIHESVIPMINSIASMIVKSYCPEAASHLWLRQSRANKSDLSRKRKYAGTACVFDAFSNSVRRLFCESVHIHVFISSEKIL